MIFGLRKTFNDYEEVRISDQSTRYRYAAGPSAASSDGSIVALAETYVVWEWQGPPGSRTLVPTYRDGRIRVRHGSEWSSNTLLTDPIDDYTGFYYHGAHDLGHVATSADGSVIASVNTCDTSDWTEDTPPVWFGFGGTLNIHYGSSWGSVVRKHGYQTYQNSVWHNFTNWGAKVAVSGDGSVVVVSEPGHVENIAGINVTTGRLHVYSGTNWATHTIISNPWNDGGSNGYDSTYMGSRSLSISNDGSTIFASLDPSQDQTFTWAGTPGESDYDLTLHWTPRILAFSGAGWSTSAEIAYPILTKTDHYHYEGNYSHTLTGTTWYRWWGDYGSYVAPNWGESSCSDDGLVLFVSDPSYQDDKGAVHVYSGAGWTTHTIVTLSGTQSKQYAGAQYISDLTTDGSYFGDQVRCSADGGKFFASQGGSYYEFVKPSGTWNEAGGTVLTDSIGEQPEIARGSYPIMLSPAQTTGQWGAQWIRVDLLSFGLGAGAVIKATRSKLASASAIVKRNRQGSFTIETILSEPYLKAMSIIRRSWTVTMSANATLMPRFRANAVKRRVWEKAQTASAYITGPIRNTHDRGSPPHYHDDLDSVIVLSKSLGIYQQGMDLHAVLTALVNRVVALESGSDDLPAGVLTFSASSVLRRPDIASALSAAAMLVHSYSTESIVNAILRRIAQQTATADSILRAERGSAASLDAYVVDSSIHSSVMADAVILRVVELVTTAASVVRREQVGSLGSDSIVQREMIIFTATDAVVLRIASAQTTANAIALRSMGGSGLVDAVLFNGSGVEGSLTANAILSAILRSRARIVQQVVEMMVTLPTYSPTTPTGAGVTQQAVEMMVADAGSGRVSQTAVEMMVAGDGDARVDQSVVEMMVTLPTYSPTTPTGAGVTQAVVEMMVSGTDNNAKITQTIIEMMVREN